MEEGQVKKEVPVANETVAEKENVASEEPVFKDDKKKAGRGMVAGLVILAILAIGGVGFGIWAWMDGNARADILNEYNNELQAQNNELAEKLANLQSVDENGNGNGNGSENVDVDINVDENTANYIYVGEWGIKIKKSEKIEKLSYVWYSYDRNYYTDSDSSFCISGVVGYDGKLPGFASLGVNFPGMVCLKRLPNGSEPSHSGKPTKAFSDGKYDYWFNFGVTAFSNTSGEYIEELDKESESDHALYEMLNNPDNYSAI